MGYTKAGGKMITCISKGESAGVMEQPMKENTQMVSGTDRASVNTQVATRTLVHSKMVSFTVRACTPTLMEKHTKVNSKTVI